MSTSSTYPRGLSAADLAAVVELERRVVAADSGRLKLEWGTLRSRSGDQWRTCWSGTVSGCWASRACT